jgi:hypothetical protein
MPATQRSHMMKKTGEPRQASTADMKLDRLEIYSLTARGLMLALALLMAFSILSGFSG